MKGWKGGEVIGEAIIKRLARHLNRNKVAIARDDWALEVLDKSGDAAQFVRFKDGSAGILLRPNATRYQLVHELKHYEQWLANQKEYAKLSKLEREEYVFNALQTSNHWRRFTKAEKKHAREYIEYVRKLYRN